MQNEVYGFICSMIHSNFVHSYKLECFKLCYPSSGHRLEKVWKQNCKAYLIVNKSRPYITFRYSNLHWGGDKVRSSDVSDGAVIGLKMERGLSDPACAESDMTVDSEVIPCPNSGPGVTWVWEYSSTDCFLSCVDTENCLVNELISWLLWE